LKNGKRPTQTLWLETMGVFGFLFLEGTLIWETIKGGEYEK